MSRIEVCVCFSILAAVLGATLWFSVGFTHGMEKSSVPFTEKLARDYSFEDQAAQIEEEVSPLIDNSVPFIPETVPQPQKDDVSEDSEFNNVTPADEQQPEVEQPRVQANDPFPLRSDYFDYYTNLEGDKNSFIVENVLYRPENNFLEGFYYDKETMAFYESAGLYKKSKVQRLNADPETNVLQIDETGVTKLADRYFGEGLAPRSESEFALLTYRERVLMTVDRETMKLLGRSYSIPEEIKEGWGFTADESVVNENGYYTMYASDGSSNIYEISGETMKVMSTIKVWNPFTNQFQKKINELEFADGFIYANVWYEDTLLKIDPQTGMVVKQYNIEALQWAEEYFQTEKFNAYRGDCLNGIAYDATTKSFYLTGKYFHLVFKVQLL